MSPKSSNNSRPKQKNSFSNYQFNNIALGGTFDRFHKGHRHFLQNAFTLSRQLTIGITSSDLAEKIHKNSQLQSFNERKRQVLEFLKKSSFLKRSKLITLEDPSGPTATDSSFQALLVTKNTLQGARAVNRKRRDNGLFPLKIIVYPLVKTADGQGLSSQRIREGEINREGVIFHRELTAVTPLSLPRQLRPTFREPFGTVIPADSKKIDEGMRKALELIKGKRLNPIICVGDVVTHSILKFEKVPKLSIVDLRVQRKIRYKQVSEIGPIAHLRRYRIVNPAGTVTKKLSRCIRDSLQKDSKSVIQVKGEEDLAVLPCVLLAALDSVVFYGHFQQGLIVIEVTEEKKSEALKLLQLLKRFAGYDT